MTIPHPTPSVPSTTVDALLATALAAAEAAAKIHADQTGRLEERWIEVKTTASDFISNVDVASQAAALAVIQSKFPDHYVMAEEGEHAGEMDPTAEFTWIVDPLDGTTNFLHDHPFYASSVAVWDKNGPVAGVVHAQALEKIWSAVRGEGATENGEAIHVSDNADVSRFLVGTGFPFKSLDDLPRYQAQFARVLSGTAGMRRAGAAAIDLAYMARGSLDAFWELDLHPWDFGAGLLLITEAGGVTERLEGGQVLPARGTVIAANSGKALVELRTLILG